jgi:DNA topoisomerase III
VILVVAEKPSVARDLARVLGVRASGKSGYFEGERHIITYCVGHLVELEEPAAYNPAWKSWRLETLPMLPEPFRYRPVRGTASQLRVVCALLRDRRIRQVVNACDAGREGELIFRAVVEHAGGAPPVSRLWISSLTDEAIRAGFAALRPGAELDNLGDAARCRSEADWLVGMNATRALTARGAGTLYSVGRVQTPTLAMVAAREREIRAFVPRDYHEVHADYGFRARWTWGKATRLGPAAEAARIVDRCGKATAVVERVERKIVREPPPLLFDLTSLQRTANKRFGLTAQNTLKIAQALYETHKVTTYPRTDSRYLPSDMTGTAVATFRALTGGEPPRMPGRRVFDNAKVSDHHAIIPTGKQRSLGGDEARVYDLILRRFLGVFHPDAEIAVTDVVIKVGDGQGAPPATTDDILLQAPPPPDRFHARGRIRLVAGWQEVAGFGDGASAEDKAEGNTDDAQALPPLAEGQRLDGTYKAVAKKTLPPQRFTDATLLAAMESAGKSLDDEELRQAMKDRGLGTPATRASILETLLRRGYLARDRKLLVPTETGMSLIAALPVPSLTSPEMTGEWEARLARVARGDERRDVFMKDVTAFVRQVVGAITFAGPPAGGEARAVGRCPRCSGDVLERRSSFQCGGCGLEVPGRVAGRIISAQLAAVLLGRGRTQVLKGFKSKAGKRFSAALVLENHEVRFSFTDGPKKDGKRAPAPPPPPREALPDLTCPRCTTGTLVAGKRAWGCGRWREGCALVIPFMVDGKKVTRAQLEALVTKGRTRAGAYGGGKGRLVLGDAGVVFEASAP